MVGDPLEKACLGAVDWSLTRSEFCYIIAITNIFLICFLDDTVIPKKGKQLPLRIIHRHHFSSAMKRMSVIVGYIPVGTTDVHHVATVKGAPETLKSMFVNAPPNYDEIYQQFTRQGARVLALGYKQLGQLSHQQVRVIWLVERFYVLLLGSRFESGRFGTQIGVRRIRHRFLSFENRFQGGYKRDPTLFSSGKLSCTVA